MGLDKDQIAALYAGRRVKGLYQVRTVEFHDSDELGVDPMEQWEMDFGSKSPVTVFQGFRNAVEKGGLTDVIDVIQRDGKVYLLHRERCGMTTED